MTYDEIEAGAGIDEHGKGMVHLTIKREGAIVDSLVMPSGAARRIGAAIVTAADGAAIDELLLEFFQRKVGLDFDKALNTVAQLHTYSSNCGQWNGRAAS